MMDDAVRPTRGTASERWLPIFGAALAAGGGLLIVSGLERLVPPCLFRSWTGLYCPGCGSGRMLLALSHLDVATAFRMNPFAFIVLPFVGYGLLAEGLSAWGIIQLPAPRVRAGWYWALLWVVLAFWVLRNIPVWPLTLLAPY